MGRVRSARVGAEPARGRQRPGRRRARLRHRLLLLVAGAPRRPGGRRRSHPGAACNRAAAPGRNRDRVSPGRGDRRGRAAAGFVVRPRSLRVRRIALGRPEPLGPGGRALAPARRAARLSDQLDRLRALHDHGRCRRAARAAAVRVGQVGRWPDTNEVEFHLAHGDWIELLHKNGFEVERLVELFANPESETHTYYKYVTAEWARKWPPEEAWAARKRG